MTVYSEHMSVHRIPDGVLYAGSFDPITNGHLDIIERAHKLFGGLTILVATSNEKSGLFSIQERVELIKETTKHLNNIKVDSTTGLLVEYAKKKDAKILIRGLRAVSDFDFEFAMASMNSSLHSELETVFLMTSSKVYYISSRFVKEVASLGGDVSQHAPQTVIKALKKKLTQG